VLHFWLFRPIFEEKVCEQARCCLYTPCKHQSSTSVGTYLYKQTHRHTDTHAHMLLQMSPPPPYPRPPPFTKPLPPHPSSFGLPQLLGAAPFSGISNSKGSTHIHSQLSSGSSSRKSTHTHTHSSSSSSRSKSLFCRLQM